RHEPEDLILAVLFSAFAVFTKNEGLPLALANGAVILGFGIMRNRLRGLATALVFFAGVLAIDSAWFLWNWRLPRTHEDYGTKLLSSLMLTNLPRLKQIIPAIAGRMMEFHTWGLLWIMFGLLALLGWRGFARPYVSALWILVGLHLTTYMFVYVVTPWDLPS